MPEEEEKTPGEESPPRPPKKGPTENPARGGLLGGRVLSLGTVRGIRFDLDPSWFFIFAYVIYALGTGYGQNHEDWSGAAVWGAAVVASTLFFLSVFLHELGHSVVALSLGLKVRSITLFLFGGVAELSGDPKRPRDEFLIAVAGPAVNCLLSLGYLVLLLGSESGSPVQVVSGWLAAVNLGVAVFNMLPGFPLDGGRVFRAVLWRVLEDFERATQWAGKVGVLLGNALTALGLVLAILGGRITSGLFLAFIGWFLSRSAQSNTVQAILTSRLRALRVGDASSIGEPPVDAWDTLEEVVESSPTVRVTGVLVQEDGEVVGALGPAELEQTAPSKYAFHAARSVMTPIGQLLRIHPGETLFNALKRMEKENVTQLLVEQGGLPLGLLSRDSLTRAVNQS